MIATAGAAAGAVILFYSVRFALADIGVITAAGVYVVVIAVFVNCVMRFVILACQAWAGVIPIDYCSISLLLCIEI